MNNCVNHKICLEEALVKAKTLCNQKGVKFTVLRERVLKLIWKSHTYVKAYDLLDDLKKIDPSAKPPTVYRSLDFLIENGFIHKIESLITFVKLHDVIYIRNIKSKKHKIFFKGKFSKGINSPKGTRLTLL